MTSVATLRYGSPKIADQRSRHIDGHGGASNNSTLRHDFIADRLQVDEADDADELVADFDGNSLAEYAGHRFRLSHPGRFSNFRRHRSTPPTFPYAVFAGLLIVGGMLATVLVLAK